MKIRDILLVEDDPRDLELTLVMLEECNLANQVCVVRGGDEALDYLYRRGDFEARTGGHPIAVLLDLKMPKVSGLEVLKIIKADPSFETVPILMLTSARNTPDVTECFHYGADACLVKPVAFPALMHASRRLGIFWALVGQPQPRTAEASATEHRDETVLPGKGHHQP